MKRFLVITSIALMAAMGAVQSSAQVRLQPVAPGPKVAPKVVIPPSAAVQRVLGKVPGAQPLSAKIRGNMYVVKVKQGGKVLQFNVNPSTGAMSRLP